RRIWLTMPRSCAGTCSQTRTRKPIPTDLRSGVVVREKSTKTRGSFFAAVLNIKKLGVPGFSSNYKSIDNYPNDQSPRWATVRALQRPLLRPRPRFSSGTIHLLYYIYRLIIDNKT